MSKLEQFAQDNHQELYLATRAELSTLQVTREDMPIAFENWPGGAPLEHLLRGSPFSSIFKEAIQCRTSIASLCLRHIADTCRRRRF